MIKPLARAISFSFILLIASISAHAESEPEIIRQMLDNMAEQSGGVRPTYESLKLDDSGNIILSGLLSRTGHGNNRVTISVDTIRFNGVSKRRSGTYVISQAEWNGAVIDLNNPDTGPVHLSVPTSTARNVYFIAAENLVTGKPNLLAGTAVYETGNIPVIKLKFDGKGFEAKNIKVKWKGDRDSGYGRWNMSLGSLAIPVKAISDRITATILQDLQYQILDIGFNGNFALEEKNGNLAVGSALTLSGQKMGQIELVFAGQDIPVALIEKMRQMQDGDKENMAGMMSYMMGMKLSGLKLRIADNSLIRKALPYLAEKEGMSLDAYIDSAVKNLKQALSDLPVPELQQQTVNAVRQFLLDPKNLTFQAKPEQPVSATVLMGLIIAPATAVKMLGVSISANE